jgi:hypothetical protein
VARLSSYRNVYNLLFLCQLDGQLKPYVMGRRQSIITRGISVGDQTDTSTSSGPVKRVTGAATCLLAGTREANPRGYSLLCVEWLTIHLAMCLCLLKKSPFFCAV